jgi:hypothetical protein
MCPPLPRSLPASGQVQWPPELGLANSYPGLVILGFAAQSFPPRSSCNASQGKKSVSKGAASVRAATLGSLGLGAEVETRFRRRGGDAGAGSSQRLSRPRCCAQEVLAANLNKVFTVWPEMLEEEGRNPSRVRMRAVASAAAAATGTVAAGAAAGGVWGRRCRWR